MHLPAAEQYVNQDEVKQQELTVGIAVPQKGWPDIRRPIRPLYKSEREFVDLILQGKTKKQIMRKMKISADFYKVRVDRIKKKVGFGQ